MRDEYGDFPHGSAAAVFGAGTEHAHQTHPEKEHHGISAMLHLSGSSSSSSGSEDDGMGGRRKKDKKKNKNTGETEEHKYGQDQGGAAWPSSMRI